MTNEVIQPEADILHVSHKKYCHLDQRERSQTVNKRSLTYVRDDRGESEDIGRRPEDVKTAPYKKNKFVISKRSPVKRA